MFYIQKGLVPKIYSPQNHVGISIYIWWFGPVFWSEICQIITEIIYSKISCNLILIGYFSNVRKGKKLIRNLLIAVTFLIQLY